MYRLLDFSEKRKGILPEVSFWRVQVPRGFDAVNICLGYPSDKEDMVYSRTGNAF